MDKWTSELYEKSYFKMLYEMSYWKAEIWVAAKQLDGTVVRIVFVTVSMDKPFYLSKWGAHHECLQWVAGGLFKTTSLLLTMTLKLKQTRKNLPSNSFLMLIITEVLISESQSVQSLSRVQLFATPWITACQASLSIINSWSSLRFTSIESVRSSSHLILCRPLLLPPPIPPSIRVFSNESTLRMRWPKY